VSSERLPALLPIQSHASTSSTSSSPRGDSISSGSVGGGSAGSNTSYAASVNGQTAGFKTPSPEQTPQSLSRDNQSLNAQSVQSSPFGTQDGYGFAPGGYNSMNQMQSYADVHQSHMATATHAPASAPPSGLSHYAYPPQSSMMQPQHQYSQAPPGYPSYGYPNGVGSQIPASSSMNPAMVPSTLQLPGMFEVCNRTTHSPLTFIAMSSGAPASSLPGSQSYQPQTFDHTGQVAPPGMKPRVTATLWEDEGSLCFQVEAKGVCVARREGKGKLLVLQENATLT
jgi:protein SOK2